MGASNKEPSVLAGAVRKDFIKEAASDLRPEKREESESLDGVVGMA